MMQQELEVKNTSTYEKPTVVCVHMRADVIRTSGNIGWNSSAWGDSFRQDRETTFIEEGN